MPRQVDADAVDPVRVVVVEQDVAEQLVEQTRARELGDDRGLDVDQAAGADQIGVGATDLAEAAVAAS